MKDTPLTRLKAHLRKAESAFNELQDTNKQLTDEFFPYVFRRPGDPPLWQRAIIKMLPYRPYMEGEEIWIKVGEATVVDADYTHGMDTEDDNQYDVDELFISNLLGPNDDTVAFYGNQIERKSGPDDYSWDDVDEVKYKDWDQGVVELSDEEKEELDAKIAEMETWDRESRAIYKEWLEKKRAEMGLGILAEDGRDRLL